MVLFRFKKGVRQKKEIQKFVHFILKKCNFADLSSFKLIINKLSLQNMCVREDRFSLVFCVLFFFSAKQRVSEAYLRVRENPGQDYLRVRLGLGLGGYELGQESFFFLFFYFCLLFIFIYSFFAYRKIRKVLTGVLARILALVLVFLRCFPLQFLVSPAEKNQME